MLRKKIDEITWDEVVSFCEEGHKERIDLEYKKDFPKNLEKTLSSFANTQGGLIIIGVEEDKDSKPEKWEGIDYKDKLEEKIFQIITNTISPIFKPDIAVCHNADKSKSFILIRVFQSHQSPHSIDGHTSVYLRVGPISYSEKKATIDQIISLSNKDNLNIRNESSNVINSNINFETFNNKSVNIILKSSPVQLINKLTTAKSIHESIKNYNFIVSGYNSYFPSYKEILPVKEGLNMIHDKQFNFINEYGVIETYIKDSEIDKNSSNRRLLGLVHSIDLYIDYISEIYSKTSYYAPINFSVSISLPLRLDVSGFKDTSRTFEEDFVTINSREPFTLSKEIYFSEINSEENKKNIVIELVLQLMWDIGFLNYTKEDIEGVFEYKK